MFSELLNSGKPISEEIQVDSLLGWNVPEPKESDSDYSEPNSYNSEDGQSEFNFWRTHIN